MRSFASGTTPANLLANGAWRTEHLAGDGFGPIAHVGPVAKIYVESKRAVVAVAEAQGRVANCLASHLGWIKRRRPECGSVGQIQHPRERLLCGLCRRHREPQRGGV